MHKRSQNSFQTKPAVLYKLCTAMLYNCLIRIVNQL